MARRTKIAVQGLVWLLVACGADEPGTAHRAADSEAPLAAGSAEEQLDALFESYFDAMLEMNPIYATFIGDNRFNDRLSNNLSADFRERAEALEQQYLQSVEAIDPGALSVEAQLDRAVFLRDRRMAIEGFRFPDHLVPINQFFGLHNLFAVMGSGGGIQPFNTLEDYRNWLGRIDGFVVWMHQARENMLAGIEQDIVQPRIVMQRVLPQLEGHVVAAAEDSIFWKPIENLPDGFTAEEREELTAAFRQAIMQQIVPAYRDTQAFIRDRYLPHTRESVGLSELPNGAAWYAYLVRNTTTTDLSPQQIHEIGLAEVERIHAEMTAVMQQVDFAGELSDFFAFLNEDERFYFDEEEQLLRGYYDLRDEVHAKALKLFEALPKADYEIRAVEAFRAKSASGGSYMGATPDGSRPGVFYVNTYDLSARPKWAMESLFLHEAVPGHHFQGALSLELTELPRFRRFGGYTAFGEGWGLYAESLGKELGVYEDPYQYFGALAAELWRAIRLVVDTGLHAKGWTREQVLEYMYANTAVKEARAVSEAERYIAIPSQALAYKIGQLKLTELRARAEEALGEDFDVKAFHAQILGNGELPLDVLEREIERWIERVRSS